MRLLALYVVNVLNFTSRVSAFSIGASRTEKVAADGLQFTFPVREAPIPVPVRQELDLSTYVIYNGRRRTYKSRIQLITVGQLVMPTSPGHGQDRWAILTEPWTATHCSAALGEPRADPVVPATPALWTSPSLAAVIMPKAKFIPTWLTEKCPIPF